MLSLHARLRHAADPATSAGLAHARSATHPAPLAAQVVLPALPPEGMLRAPAWAFAACRSLKDGAAAD